MISAPQVDPGPNWDLTSLFPSLDSSKFAQSIAEISQELWTLEKKFVDLGIDRGAEAANPMIAPLLEDMGEISGHFKLLRSYVSAWVTTNSENQDALAKASELDLIGSRIAKLSKSLSSWLSGANLLSIESETGKLRDHRYFISKAQIEAMHQLSTSEESLISDLEITGSTAWKKLYSNVSSQIKVALTTAEGTRLISMSQARALATDRDRELRRTAQEAEIEAWKTSEVPIAAALNSIKGETITLCRRRGWDSPLSAALFSANIDAGTLDAMQEAVKNSFPDFRRFLSAKAKMLGIPKMSFYDLFAPLETGVRSWNWREAETFVSDQFRGYSDQLADFADRAFRERWIDYPPRSAKVDGAYCMGVRNDESRILMNFKPAFYSVSTLAHELGHGYHNFCLAKNSDLLRTSPMTLAETASIFCETLIRKAVLKNGTPEEKIAVLDASITGNCQIVVDIHSRYLFESEVFAAREKRELSASELCGFMLEAQKATYGNGLVEPELHPYMWAAKPHYYGRAFYNFPYTFGLLFALGLYTIYQSEGSSFHARYDELLSSTGLASAADLAANFGIDIQDVRFWSGSLDQIREDIQLYESLASGSTA